MSNAVSVIPNNKGLITAEELAILKNTKFKGFTDAEVSFCAKVVNQLNLSPFLNQIHFTKRKNKDGTYSVVTQVGIDGFRLSAQRAGGYAGSDEPVFEYDPKDTKKQYPLKATVTVYKMIEGTRCPFTASARWDEYFPGEGPNAFMWNKMPHNQLAKCAEALALRKACPAELSSVYAEDELHQARELEEGRITPGMVDDIKVNGKVIPAAGSGVVGADGYYVPAHLDRRVAGKLITECDPHVLSDVVGDIEAKYKRLGKPIPSKGQEFIAEATAVLNAHSRSIAMPGDFNHEDTEF